MIRSSDVLQEIAAGTANTCTTDQSFVAYVTPQNLSLVNIQNTRCDA